MTAGGVGLVLLTMLSGCAVLPIPTRRHVPSGYDTRGSIPAAALDSVDRPGVSRTQVLLALGEPDRSWQEDRFFFYRWSTVAGYWLWFLGGGYQGVGGLIGYGEREHDVVLEFDDEGRLLRRGSLPTWAPSEPGSSAKVPSRPRVVAAEHVHASGLEVAQIALDTGEVRFHEDGRSRHDVMFLPQELTSVRLRRFAQIPPSADRVGCVLTYRRPGRHHERLRVVLTPENALDLLDYVRRTRPTVPIEGDRR